MGAITLDALLRAMLEQKASDLHIRADGPAVMRIDGQLIPVEGTLSEEDARAMAFQMLNDHQKKIYEARHECDLSFSLKGVGRFRANVFQQMGRVNVAIRIVPETVPSFESLKLPDSVRKIADSHRGLVLVTGTTGSGKSTTLAAMVDHINRTRQAHIVTIEDPIEFIHKDQQSILSQRELGWDTLSYADALRNAVRQDPDVILLGEMRDQETMAAALTAAQTGHLVLSTIHTIDAVQTVTRIVDMFPPHQQNQVRLQLADILRGIVSQRLLPHASGKGRVPAVEVLVVTALIKKLIAESNTGELDNAMKQGAYYGMQTFNQALVKLVDGKEVTQAAALDAASNPEEMMLALRGIQSGSDTNAFYGH